MVRKTTKVPVKKKSAAKRKAKKSTVKKGELMSPLATLREEVDNLFERFSEDWPSLPRQFGRGVAYPFARKELQFSLPSLDLSPRVDVSEDDDAYKISMELPGMTEKEIEVELSDESLTVKGEKQEEREEKKKNYHVSERSYGSFQRSFRVPSGVEVNKVNAKYSSGVLDITLPKTDKAKKSKRSINVKAG